MSINPPITIEKAAYNDEVESEFGDISESGESGSSERSKSLESASSPTQRSSSNGSSSGFLSKVLDRNSDEHHVCGARFCFFLVLLIAGVSLGTMVFLITSNDAQKDFRDEFVTSSEGLTFVSNRRLARVLEGMQAISLTITSFIEDGHTTKYPPSFTHFPGVETNFGFFIENNGASLIGYTPIITDEDERDRWLNYSQHEAEWVNTEPIEFRHGSSILDTYDHDDEEDSGHDAIQDDVTVAPYIWKYIEFDDHGEEIPLNDSDCDRHRQHDHKDLVQVVDTASTVNPLWHYSPPPKQSGINAVNFNVRSEGTFKEAFELVEKHHRGTIHDICSSGQWFKADGTQDTFAIVVPVFETFVDPNSESRPNATLVGHLFSILPWKMTLEGLLTEGEAPIATQVTSSCGTDFRAIVDGPEVIIVSVEEWDSSFDHVTYSVPIGEFVPNACHYTLTTFATAEFKEQYVTNVPWIYVAIVLSFFAVTCCGFLLFDSRVFTRQRQLVETANKQNAIVSSLFPKSIQKQLMEDMEIADDKKKSNKSGTAHLRSYLLEEAIDSKHSNEKNGAVLSKPIADLFPETTIMFADIAGFTAWSSVREPSQVFTLLESIYSDFDAIAKRRRIFKVEVVGDCYVAVAGLPDPRPDHATAMAKFANDCMKGMRKVCASLEVTLGPDTTELKLRIGLHSGPVVAGVLRGERSRFQLFGDTMNTASRMESTGVPGSIQVSKETADLITEAGKQSWLIQRESKVQAKGKGELTTFFLDMETKIIDTARSFSEPSNSKGDLLMISMMDAEELKEKKNRIAEWTVEVLSKVLRSIIAERKANCDKAASPDTLENLEIDSLSRANNKTIIDEVAAKIVLPTYNAAKKSVTEESVDLDESIVLQLRHYVQTIASLYNNNPFHNFDHANHVVMSVNKLLSRIKAPDLEVDANGKMLYDHTYGITSDPLTWFACVFSALIHDVDHSGVPNAQLVKEDAPIARLYCGKSVAEQNSFDIAWDLLMEPGYKNLRRIIYTTEGEFKRFRQLVINSVMATDIVDQDLKKLRQDRWDAAFNEGIEETAKSKDLKATIVIEHLIQASDVAHTMQHWHVYRRWNERFFMECYLAYLDKRAEENPADSWYKGELGFFDFYIIPLAKKLKDCGVFGVSSDEYLSYALQNRKEWEERGEEMVKEMIKNACLCDLAKQRMATSNADASN